MTLTSGYRIVAIIQARMASSRLPGKVLLDIAGQPMLAHVVERTRRATTLAEVVVATTNDPDDDPIAAFCAARDYPFHRGSTHDVLDRFVRITADCPVIDPEVIDKTVTAFLGVSGLPAAASKDGTTPTPTGRPTSVPFPYDFVANRLPPPWGRTYPIGLDTEVCTFAGLELAWKEATQPHQREHVMPFFYEQPQRFRILLVNHDKDYGSLRWTVDTPEDLALLRHIFAKFAGREFFSWLDILELVKSEPELMRLNAQVQAKDYRRVDERLHNTN